jgi:hypothetical protein
MQNLMTWSPELAAGLIAAHKVDQTAHSLTAAFAEEEHQMA